MSSFFTTPASQRKRKRDGTLADRTVKRRDTAAPRGGRSSVPKSSRRQDRDESISGSESGDSEYGQRGNDVISGDESDSSAEGETAAERRLRLAERYLENLREEVDEAGFDAEEIDRDLIAERLKEDVAETKGKVYRYIASDLNFSAADKTFFTADQRSITGVATCEPFAYTISKDGTVVKWDLPAPVSSNRRPQDNEDEEEPPQPTNISPRRRPKFVKSYRNNRKRANDPKYLGHTAEVLCIAASSSGKFLATGGTDKRLVVWDAATLKPIKVFTQHRDSVLGLSFRRNTHTLYSASADRTIKTWSLDDLVYIETLFGHQDHVVDIAGMAAEMCVSVGARDRTARVWKVVEESQLVFRGGGGGSKRKDSKDLDVEEEVTSFEEGSIDRVAIIDSETFVTGSDNGGISLWSINRKKPVFTIPLAHGSDPKPLLEQAFAEADMTGRKAPGRAKPRWITALTTLPFSDVILSGSWDGTVKAWKITPDKRRLEFVAEIGRSDAITVQPPMTNGDHALNSDDTQPSVRGIITDVSVFERGDRGKDGLCIVAAVSKEHRLGRWSRPGSKNGAVVFNVARGLPFANGALTNGDGGDSPAP